MGLAERIQEDLKTAMKAKDKESLEALRAIKGALLLAKTEEGARDSLTEDQELKLLQKLHKQRKDSALLYEEQNRKDLAEKELAEAQIIERYLPEQMSEEDLEAYLKNLIETMGATSMKDMGKVMGAASKELAGKAEGKIISAKVKTLLNS
ncbi:MAG: GatB/YqeY domain-containing protein [Bacteroidales bacterium]|jgi:uncharacterized protein YqeY